MMPPCSSALPRESLRGAAEEVSARLSARLREWGRVGEQYDDLTVVVAAVR
jgi:hypothetical protein